VENGKKLVVLPKNDNGNGNIYTQKDFSPFVFEDLYIEEAIYIDEMPYFTRRAIGTLLEYEDPQNSINKIISRNPHIQVLGTKVNLSCIEGGHQVLREREVYDPTGLQLIINKSTQPVAIKFQEAAAHLVYAYVTGRLTPKSEEKPKFEIPTELIEKIDQLITLTTQKKAPEPVQKPFSFPEIFEEFVEQTERIVALVEKASKNPILNATLQTWGIISKPEPDKAMIKPSIPTPAKIIPDPVIIKSIPDKKAACENDILVEEHRAKFLDCYETGNKLGVSGQKVLYWDKLGRFDGYKQPQPPFKITISRLKKWARIERLDDLTDLTELKSEITTPEAAKFFASGKTFIHKAIYDRVIKAKKNNSGRFLINTESLINLMQEGGMV